MKAINALSICVTLLLGSAFAEAQKPLEKDLDFHSGEFRCKVTVDGRFQDVVFLGQPVVKEICIYGKDESNSQRMLQGEAPSRGKTTVQANDDGSLIVRTEGFLARGQKEPKVASYVQTSKLSSTGIDLDCEVETLVPMSGRMHIFSTSMSLPIESYLGRGYLLERAGRASELWTVPLNYSKDSDIHAFGSQAAFSLKGFVIGVSCIGSLCVSDERSWKGKNLKVDVQQPIGWFHTPVCYNPGFKFKWSMKLRFNRD